jgi:hypothetical protein
VRLTHSSLMFFAIAPSTFKITHFDNYFQPKLKILNCLTDEFSFNLLM